MPCHVDELCALCSSVSYFSVSMQSFVLLQFPYCTDDEAISVACLDLHYSVSVRTNVLPKPDTHTPATLISNMQEESSVDSIDLEGSNYPLLSCFAFFNA